LYQIICKFYNTPFKSAYAIKVLCNVTKITVKASDSALSDRIKTTYCVQNACGVLVNRISTTGNNVFASYWLIGWRLLIV
jgi:hypothetical protein